MYVLYTHAMHYYIFITTLHHVVADLCVFVVQRNNDVSDMCRCECRSSPRYRRG